MAVIAPWCTGALPGMAFLGWCCITGPHATGYVLACKQVQSHIVGNAHTWLNS